MPYDTTTVTYSTRPYTNGSLSGTCQGSGTVFVPVGHYDLGQMKARLAGTAPKESARISRDGGREAARL